MRTAAHSGPRFITNRPRKPSELRVTLIGAILHTKTKAKGHAAGLLSGSGLCTCMSWP